MLDHVTLRNVEVNMPCQQLASSFNLRFIPSFSIKEESFKRQYISYGADLCA